MSKLQLLSVSSCKQRNGKRRVEVSRRDLWELEKDLTEESNECKGIFGTGNGGGSRRRHTKDRKIMKDRSF